MGTTLFVGNGLPDPISLIVTILATCCLLVGLPHMGVAQSTFYRSYGGTGNDKANVVRQLPDGSFIVAGETYSFGAGSRDVYLFRTDPEGNTLWAKTHGGSGEDYALTMDLTTDSMLIIGAHTGSFGQGGHDHYFLKTDLNGDTVLTRVYGGGAPDGVYKILEPFSFSGYYLTGHTSSFGAGAHDYHIIRISEQGDTLWTRALGGPGGDYLRNATQVVLASTPPLLCIGETDGYGVGGFDILLTRTDPNGDLDLARTYGGVGNDYGYAVLEDQVNGGTLIVGHTNSFGAGSYDVHLTKVDYFGDVVWSRTIGGPGDEFAYDARITPEGEFIIVGSTTSFGGGGKDVYLFRTDAVGDTIWTKAYGDLGDEEAWSVDLTSDGGCIIAGSSNNTGQGIDALLIKTDSAGNAPCHMHGTTSTVGPTEFISTTPTLQVAHGAVGGSTATLSGAVPSDGISCPTVGLSEAGPVGEMVMKISPNPTVGWTTVTFDALSDRHDRTLLVLDTQGRLVRELTGTTDSKMVFDATHLAAGLYILRLLEQQTPKAMGKLVVQ